MKLLTLNTHSLIEEHYPQKLQSFVEVVSREMPQVIALQEVNQTACGAVVPKHLLTGYCPCDPSAVIREDNHVYNVVRQLADKDIHYYWTWLPLKLGYDKYDEGIALMSLSPILETDVVLVSEINDYYNWKTRKLVGIRTKAAPDEWFYSVHYGWWDDAEEPFQGQWKKTNAHMLKHDIVWLMGDFNSPAEVRGEGYDMLIHSCWHDSYILAERKDRGVTVGRVIDGWKDKIACTTGMRIDQIWCSQKVEVIYSKVVLNGIHYPIVSDHYGVMIDYEERS